MNRRNQIRIHALLAPGMALLLFVGCSKSNNPEVNTQYKAFADAHWSEEPYFDSLESIYYIDRWQDGNAQWAHHLPFAVNGTDTTADHNQAYYENIGKYDQFIWGWDDLQQITDTSSIPEFNFGSINRRTYRNMMP